VDPVPLSVMLKVGFEAFEAIATLPLASPGDCGAKVTLKDALCPGARVNGRLRPVLLKAAPETVACVMVRLVAPVLLSVSERDWLVPVCTLPKLMLEGAAVSAPCWGFGVPCKAGLLVLSPWQPIRVAKASTTTSAFQRARRFSIGDLISLVPTAPER